MFVICTDGSCSGNPGPGGYAAIIKDNSFRERIVSGNEADTTNQRMELKAVLAGLSEIPPNQEVIVLSDSEYVINTIRRGWKKKANKDLWDQLDVLIKRQIYIDWVWIKGHDGHPDNERVNEIAQSETKKAKEAANEALRVRGENQAATIENRG